MNRNKTSKFQTMFVTIAKILTTVCCDFKRMRHMGRNKNEKRGVTNSKNEIPCEAVAYNALKFIVFIKSASLYDSKNIMVNS